MTLKSLFWTGYDGFTFYIDDVVMIPFTSNKYLSWSSFNVSRGTHMLTFKYSKDYSVSSGEDRAFIYTLIFEGTQFADSQCTLCSPGTYISSPGGSECFPCSQNTNASSFGSSQCSPCPAGTYSFEGSANCTRKAPCRTWDYESIYTPCRPGVVMDHFYQWRKPFICDNTNLALPANETNIPCFPCQPGQQRQGGDYVCRPCETGKYLVGSTCMDCGPGMFAPKLNIVSRWDMYPPGWTFGCHGDLCANPTWRLLGNSIDTGVGHGPGAQPFVEIPIVAEGENTKVEVTVRLFCQSFCIISFYTQEDNYGTYYSFSNTNYHTLTFNLPQGNHTFGFYFYKYEWTDTPHPNDRLQVANITVYGDTNGGAVSCLPCAPGTSSSGSSSFCSLCPAGTYSTNGTCNLCPANTFSRNNGSTNCTSCLPGTFSSPGSAICSTNCTWFPFAGITNASDREKMLQYDLSALDQDGTMFGPVYDNSGYYYYFSVCGLNRDNRTCHDIEGNAINSYSCQVTPNDVGINLGDLFGFYAQPQVAPDQGLVLSITGGSDEGCTGTPRTVNITFICDPRKGEGYPKPPATGVIENTTDPCKYNLVWESLYACPVCSARDYTFDLGPCVAGMQEKTYKWVESPREKRCHDGVDLPPTQSIPCGNLNCPPGQWQPPGEQACVNVDPGYFSLGEANYYYDWSSLKSPFSSSCSSPGCSLWRPMEYEIASGQGNSSLFLDAEYLRDGSITFYYRTNAAMGK